MSRKRKTIECIEYLSVEAPLEKIDYLEDKQSKYIREYVRNKEYVVVGTERRHGFGRRGADRQWQRIVNKIRKKQVGGVIVSNMRSVTDSIRIYNRSHWYRWSRQYDKGNNGGSQIDFLRVFCGMDVKEAVFWLLDFAGYRRQEPDRKPALRYQVQPKAEEKREFVLPEQAGDNSYLYGYLQKERGIGKDVLNLS